MILRLQWQLNDAGADYIHVDAMKPGFNCADYSVIESIRENMDIFIIGNNSIRDLRICKKYAFFGCRWNINCEGSH